MSVVAYLIEKQCRRVTRLDAYSFCIVTGFGFLDVPECIQSDRNEDI